MNRPLPALLTDSWPVEHWRDVTVLAAVSGGADSVAMLMALAELKLAAGGVGRLLVAHFHHGLRAADADGDAQFVAALGERLGLECVIGRRSASTKADESSARVARYRFLKRVARERGARFVVTAHTADDQYETIIHRIARGTGLAGLAGIPRARLLTRGVLLIRPLLAARRTDVALYLTALGQDFRVDATNENRRYTRNYIRHEIAPRLKSGVNRRAVENVLRLGELAREAQGVVRDSVRKLHERAVRYELSGEVRVDLAAVAGQRRYLLGELAIAIWRRRKWPRMSLSRRHLNRLSAWLLGSGQARLTLPAGVQAERQGDCAVLRRTAPEAVDNS